MRKDDMLSTCRKMMTIDHNDIAQKIDDKLIKHLLYISIALTILFLQRCVTVYFHPVCNSVPYYLTMSPSHPLTEFLLAISKRF